MQKTQIIPTKDVVFKLLFATNNNQDMLRDLLQNILNKKIGNMKVVPEKISLGNFVQDKEVRNDIFIDTEDEIIIIEMQNEWHLGFENRAQMYSARNIAEQLKVKQSYVELKKVIVITIINFHYKKLDKAVNKAVRTIEPNRIIPIYNVDEYYIIDLKLFGKTKPDLTEPLDQWLLFLEYERKELLQMLAEKEERIRRAMEEMENLRADKEAREYINYIEGAREMRRFELGAERAYGIEKGEAAERRRTIKNMLKKGLADDLIVEITGISKKELEEQKALLVV